MVVYEWTDSIEKTLDIIRQNTVKLGELAQENYNALKMRIHYLQLPLAILSAANAYAVMDLDHYFPHEYVSIACCVVSASLAGYLTYDWYVDSQKQIEHDFSFHKDCLEMSGKIKDVLAVPRYDRQLDGAIFLKDIFKKYKVLVAGHKLIAQFKGDITTEKDSLCEHEEDMEGYAIDNWNIIFRPTLRRFKRKNMELIENVKKGGRSIREIVEPAISPTVDGTVDPKGGTVDPKGEVLADVFNWLNVKSKGTAAIVPIPDEKKEPLPEIAVSDEVQDIESQEKEGSLAQKPDVHVSFSDVYTIREIITAVYPKKEESKKNFSMNFMEKI